MEQFTASEVRELAATIWPDLSGREEVAEALNAFADLLEAQEKAVPVAYALFTEKGLIRMWSREWFADAHGAPVNPTPLYTHPAPSDAERLAEALERTARHRAAADRIDPDQWRSVLYSWEDRALAAYSTQAHPPAASVTDAMVGRAQDCLHDKGKDIGYYHMRAALEAALAAQENPNG